VANYIKIGDKEFPTLLAITSEEQERGLMYVDPPFPVMTFIYNSPKINSFWMNNVKDNLDIVFCCNGKVSKICNGLSYSTALIGSDVISDIVVELPFKTCEKSNIKIGDSIILKCDSDNSMKVFAALNNL
jgi:uncharacterized membrane protein (UPF0127 family)